jgi:hypothetical protein
MRVHYQELLTVRFSDADPALRSNNAWQAKTKKQLRMLISFSSDGRRALSRLLSARVDCSPTNSICMKAKAPAGL